MYELNPLQSPRGNVIVQQHSQFWQIPWAKWFALCRWMQTESGAREGYVLSERYQLPGVTWESVDRDPKQPAHAHPTSCIARAGVIYVEPLNWRPEQLRHWLESYGVPAVAPTPLQALHELLAMVEGVSEPDPPITADVLLKEHWPRNLRRRRWPLVSRPSHARRL